MGLMDHYPLNHMIFDMLIAKPILAVYGHLRSFLWTSTCWHGEKVWLHMSSRFLNENYNANSRIMQSYALKQFFHPGMSSPFGKEGLMNSEEWNFQALKLLIWSSVWYFSWFWCSYWLIWIFVFIPFPWVVVFGYWPTTRGWRWSDGPTRPSRKEVTRGEVAKIGLKINKDETELFDSETLLNF